MSNSYRTAPATFQAQVNHVRDKSGTTLLPRFVVHQPRRGDIHHLDKRLLTSLWRWIPIAYRHGIRTVELRARTTSHVGRPYALYNTRSKSIHLYSCPPLEWPVTSSDPAAFGNCELFGATIQRRAGGQLICWKTEKDAGRYLFGFVLAHELGHHYMHQYKSKRKLPTTSRAHEAGATLHAFRTRTWRAYNLVTARAEEAKAIPGTGVDRR